MTAWAIAGDGVNASLVAPSADSSSATFACRAADRMLNRLVFRSAMVFSDACR
jgi:hypothetical protein